MNQFKGLGAVCVIARWSVDPEGSPEGSPVGPQQKRNSFAFIITPKGSVMSESMDISVMDSEQKAEARLSTKIHTKKPHRKCKKSKRNPSYLRNVPLVDEK